MTAPPPLLPGPRSAQIIVAGRGWHTDLCIAAPASPDPLAILTADFPGTRFLCFGFGERQYLLSRNPGLGEMLSALLPSRAALLMTALSATPAAAFGAANVVTLPVTADGAARLKTYVWRSMETTPSGAPVRLRDGPYPGSVYLAATGTYDMFATCNTWTANGLRAAGLSIRGPVILADQVMSQARRLAAVASQ